MSEIKAFFRFCPSCGQRFHVRVVEKKLVGAALVEAKSVPFSATITSGSFDGGAMAGAAEHSTQLTVEKDEYQYSYKCNNCGHEWIELHSKQRRVKGISSEYTGD